MVAKQKSHYSKKCCNCPRSPLFNQSLCMTGIDSFIITHGNWAEKNIPPCAVFNWLQVTCCRSWLLYVRHVLIPFTKHSEFKIGERTQSDMVGNGIDRFKWQRPFTRRKIASPPLIPLEMPVVHETAALAVLWNHSPQITPLTYPERPY